MSGLAVTVVESGGLPVRQVETGAPLMTAVESGGVAVTIGEYGPAFVIEGTAPSPLLVLDFANGEYWSEPTGDTAIANLVENPIAAYGGSFDASRIVPGTGLQAARGNGFATGYNDDTQFQLKDAVRDLFLTAGAVVVWEGTWEANRPTTNTASCVFLASWMDSSWDAEISLSYDIIKSGTPRNQVAGYCYGPGGTPNIPIDGPADLNRPSPMKLAVRYDLPAVAFSLNGEAVVASAGFVPLTLSEIMFKVMSHSVSDSWARTNLAKLTLYPVDAFEDADLSSLSAL